MGADSTTVSLRWVPTQEDFLEFLKVVCWHDRSWSLHRTGLAGWVTSEPCAWSGFGVHSFPTSTCTADDDSLTTIIQRPQSPQRTTTTSPCQKSTIHDEELQVCSRQAEGEVHSWEHTIPCDTAVEEDDSACKPSHHELICRFCLCWNQSFGVPVVLFRPCFVDGTADPTIQKNASDAL